MRRRERQRGTKRMKEREKGKNTEICLYKEKIEKRSKDKKWNINLSFSNVIALIPRKITVVTFRLITNHECLVD